MDALGQSPPLPEGMPCPACGYDIGSQASPRCPECGREVDREEVDLFLALQGPLGGVVPTERFLRGAGVAAVVLGAGIGASQLSLAGGLVAVVMAFCVGLAAIGVARVACLRAAPRERVKLQVAWTRGLLWVLAPLWFAGVACIPLAAVAAVSRRAVVPGVPYGWLMVTCGILWACAVLLVFPAMWLRGFLKDVRRFGLRLQTGLGACVLAAIVCGVACTVLGFVCGVVLAAGIGEHWMRPPFR